MPAEERNFSDKALRRMEQLFGLLFKEVKVGGLDNLKTIPPGAQVVFAPTHMSDIDMHLAIYALAKHTKLKFSNYAEVFNNPAWNAGLKKLGFSGPEQVSMPLEHHQPKQSSLQKLKSLLPGQKPTETKNIFNQDDYGPMHQALNEGYAVVAAAHNPSYGWELPKNPGVAAPYLAASADKAAVIVPVAVNIKSRNLSRTSQILTQMPFVRPKAEVTIGAPLAVPHLAGLEQLSQAMAVRKLPGGQNKPPVDLKQFRADKRLLDQVSCQIMQELATMLPPEKRGQWQTKDVPKI